MGASYAGNLNNADSVDWLSASYASPDHIDSVSWLGTSFAGNLDSADNIGWLGVLYADFNHANNVG